MRPRDRAFQKLWVEGVLSTGPTLSDLKRRHQSKNYLFTNNQKENKQSILPIFFFTQDGNTTKLIYIHLLLFTELNSIVWCFQSSFFLFRVCFSCAHLFFFYSLTVLDYLLMALNLLVLEDTVQSTVKALKYQVISTLNSTVHLCQILGPKQQQCYFLAFPCLRPKVANIIVKMPLSIVVHIAL